MTAVETVSVKIHILLQHRRLYSISIKLYALSISLNLIPRPVFTDILLPATIFAPLHTITRTAYSSQHLFSKPKTISRWWSQKIGNFWFCDQGLGVQIVKSVLIGLGSSCKCALTSWLMIWKVFRMFIAGINICIIVEWACELLNILYLNR